ncbi:hypothetical protein EV199_0341 [Pseudobacter ginsenosidimutans]|uniref:Uncharacterized protein n=2 Tax=Pseudobacter ginsenosidimutans TaxID=661488 RepID=A0A4Q7MZU2_9BACT|nr:hypothetical protein EV199_0341 [Pseudobacter ginsenosidimutans]
MTTYHRCSLPKLFTFLLMLLLHPGLAPAQQGKYMHAAFIGMRWDPSATFGGGMESTEIILYFRPDGTYCTNLGNGWQTEVSGRYTIEKGAIKLIDSKKEVFPIPYDGDGSFWYNGTTIFRKEPANKIPPGYYSFSYSSGSGGIGSGTNAPYVGNRAHKGIRFNPDGSFNSSSASSTYISGENVSGYGKNKKETDGKYTIKDGVLTLHFNNGEKSVNSCFTSDAVSSIVVNGTTYYADENLPGKDKVEKGSPNKPGTRPKDMGSAREFLNKANLALGGKQLNVIKTVKLESSLGNGALQITTYLDLPLQKIRNEYRKQGQLIGIEQTEGNTGWEWSNNKFTTLVSSRIREIQLAGLSGIFNLQETALAKISILSSPEKKDQTTSMIVSVNGISTAWAFDNEQRLTGSSAKIDNRSITYLFSDFKTAQQVQLPYTVKEMRDNKTFTYKFSSIVLNPELNANNWAKPLQ